MGVHHHEKLIAKMGRSMMHSQGLLWFYGEVWGHMKVEVVFGQMLDKSGPRGWS